MGRITIEVFELTDLKSQQYGIYFKPLFGYFQKVFTFSLFICISVLGTFDSSDITKLENQKIKKKERERKRERVNQF